MKAGLLLPRFFVIGYLVTYAFSSFAVTDKCSANPAKSETFASVTKVQPPESTTHPAILAGMELILDEHLDHIAATLRDYEGTATPLTTKLEGTIQDTGTGCKVRLSGRNRRGKVEIEGTIGLVSFDATIVRTLGNQPYSETISLKRKPFETDNHLSTTFGSGPLCLRPSYPPPSSAFPQIESS